LAIQLHGVATQECSSRQSEVKEYERPYWA
jgi:hypothetical protein